MHSIPAYYVSAEGYYALMRWYDRALARLSVPITSQFVATRYGKTHILLAGKASAPPLLLLHGINTNAATWRPQIEGLAAHYRLIVPDVVGFVGRSAAARLPYDDASYALWAADVLDALGIDTAFVAGTSAGGHFALKLAVYAPSRVNAVALLNPCGLAPYHFPYGLVRLAGVPTVLNWLNYTLIASPALARLLVGKGLAPGLELNTEWVEFSHLILKHYRRYKPPGLLTDAELARVFAPTLVLVGAHEAFMPPNAVVARAAQLPGLQAAEIVADAGHDLNRDRAEWVNQRLRQFFGDYEAAFEPISAGVLTPVS